MRLAVYEMKAQADVAEDSEIRKRNPLSISTPRAALRVFDEISERE